MKSRSAHFKLPIAWCPAAWRPVSTAEFAGACFDGPTLPCWRRAGAVLVACRQASGESDSEPAQSEASTHSGSNASDVLAGLCARLPPARLPSRLHAAKFCVKAVYWHAFSNAAAASGLHEHVASIHREHAMHLRRWKWGRACAAA